jgi:hypothetical protein
MLIVLAIIALFPGYYGLTHHMVLLTYGAIVAAVLLLLVATFVSMGRNRR